MHQKCEECLKIFCQKIYKIINIIIDLVFGFFHLFAKEEEWHLRMANACKFIGTAFFNTLDTFQTFCPSFSCSKKKSILEQKIEELNQDIQKLETEKTILEEIRNSGTREPEKYKTIQTKLSTIRKLKEENEQIQIEIVS